MSVNILKTEQKENSLFITLEVSDIDSSNYIVIKAKILSYIKEHKNIFLNLSNINHIDSWGIGTLISLNASVKDEQKFIIICPHSNIYEKLKNSGLHNYFHIITQDSFPLKCPVCAEKNINCSHVKDIDKIFSATAPPTPKAPPSKIGKIIKELTKNLSPDIFLKLSSPRSSAASKAVKFFTKTLKLGVESQKRASPVIKIVKSLTGRLDEAFFKKKLSTINSSVSQEKTKPEKEQNDEKIIDTAVPYTEESDEQEQTEEEIIEEDNLDKKNNMV